MPWLHRTQASTTKAEQDGEATSESEETKRIQQATKRAKKWTCPDERTSGSEPEYALGEANMGATSMPKTSGVFHYTEWLIGKLTDDQRRKLARSFTYMDLCAGLGTTLMVHEAIRRAMARHRLKINGRCIGLTESVKDRREALGRRLDCLGLNAPIKNSNADLSGDLSDMFWQTSCSWALCAPTSAHVPQPRSLSMILWVVLVCRGWFPCLLGQVTSRRSA